MSDFRDTFEFFRTALHAYKFPMEYDEWMAVPQSKKAAALYVNFYAVIHKAWSFYQNEFSEEEDVLFTVNQVLMKNVPIIERDSARYTFAYIRTIVCNAVLGYVRRYKIRKYIAEHTVSEMEDYESDEKSERSFRFPAKEMDVLDIIERRDLARRLWDVIQNLPEEYIEVVENIVSKTHCENVSPKDRRKILADLKIILGDFRDDIPDLPPVDPVRFQSIYRKRHLKSAVVRMPDGELAVYFGEKKIIDGVKHFMFFGAEQDYEISHDSAMSYEVLEVEIDEDENCDS